MHPLSLGLSIALLISLGPTCGRPTPETEAPPTTTINVDAASLAIAPPPQLQWRGMTFAHEGYDGIRGYGGTDTEASLDSLAHLGVNAIAIVPYTFMRDAGTPAALPVPEQLGGETDASVIASIQQAHQRGWAAMLKPQIWVKDSWPGEIDFASAEDWSAWQDHYRTWILHYAQLAADHEAEALCIGTELTRAALEHPAFWRKLIEDTRAVYPGTITYAANWGQEFEGITWWDAVDVMGLNGYYPLSPKPAPTDAELLAGAEAWLSMAEALSRRVGRPWWLTEVGYRSVKQAWRNPHAEVAGRASDTLAQARCYAALFRAAADSERLQGTWIWKWPSYLGYGMTDGERTSRWYGDARTEFAPSAPVTADLVRAFYTDEKAPTPPVVK